MWGVVENKNLKLYIMTKYLYAAAVQGIQDFIFRTNDLKHIVGASELVEQICTTLFNKFEADGTSVVRAAGNIKHVFNNLEDCKIAFRNFPKQIMQLAPGITVSQAVAVFENDNDTQFGAAIDEVERILKTQRNKSPKSVVSGLMGIKRANNTGLPATRINTKGDFLDDSTIQKETYNKTKVLCEKSFTLSNLLHKNIAYDIKEITGKNDWIAIIHADGNGLGKVVQKVGKNMSVFSEFSKDLDKATKNAAQAAYDNLKFAGKIDEGAIIPIRPVVLSGDDMTVIIRGDLAIEYAKVFIGAFESETRRLLSDKITGNNVFADGKDCLTACAGIAFIKSSYPFYYGYQLAEELCGQAKKDTKAIAKERGSEDNLPDSCLMFHKVQDSFVTDYEAIVRRELSVDDGDGKMKPLFKAGPYYLVSPHDGKHTIAELENLCGRLDVGSGNGVKSGVRNWIALRLEGKDVAEQRRKRMKQLFSDTDEATIDILTDEKYGTCLAYDILAYHTIMNQETNTY